MQFVQQLTKQSPGNESWHTFLTTVARNDMSVSVDNVVDD